MNKRKQAEIEILIDREKENPNKMLLLPKLENKVE